MMRTNGQIFNNLKHCREDASRKHHTTNSNEIMSLGAEM